MPVKPDNALHIGNAALTEELKTRAGVEHCHVDPGECHEIQVWNSQTANSPVYQYRSGGIFGLQSGPCVILRVID